MNRSDRFTDWKSALDVRKIGIRLSVERVGWRQVQLERLTVRRLVERQRES